MGQEARKTVEQDAAPQRLRAVPAPPATSTLPGLALARVVGREGARWRVRVHGTEREVDCDDAVDPALLDECIASGAPVLLEGDRLVGALATRRALAVDARGNLDLKVNRFSVAAEQLALKTPGAFVELKRGEVELYGTRVLTRARELVRLLGRMIQLN